MKKIAFISVLLCLLSIFCSCEKEEVFDPFVHTDVTVWTPPQTAPLVKVTIPPAETEKIEMTTLPTKKKKKKKKPTEVPTQGVANPNGHIPVTTVMGNTTAEDIVFLWNDNEIYLNEEIDLVFLRIGEDNSSIEISDTEMSYEYQDFIIYTYTTDKDIEKIKKIEVLSDKYSTQKGVSCGDYASSLKKYYGNPIEQTATTKQYGSKQKRLIFTYQNNLITGISYEFLPQ